MPLLTTAAAASTRAVRMMGGEISPDLYRLLTHGRAVDIAALRDIFGYEMKRSSAEVLDDFRSDTRPGILSMLGGRS